MGYPLQVIQVTLGRQQSSVKADVWTSAEFSSTFQCKRVSATNSLCCRVVELVLSRATEASLNSSIFPEPLDDTSQFTCHESLFCWPRQYEQLPCIVLPRQSPAIYKSGFLLEKLSICFLKVPVTQLITKLCPRWSTVKMSTTIQWLKLKDHNISFNKHYKCDSESLHLYQTCYSTRRHLPIWANWYN